MISFIISSMHRPVLYEKCIKSIFSVMGGRGSGLDYEIVSVVDDDLETAEIALRYGHILSYSSKRRGALNCWNIGLRESRGDILVPLGDDQFLHPESVQRALAVHERTLGNYGCVAFNDLVHSGDILGTTLLFDKDFCKKVFGGVIAYTHYNYFYVDNELNERAKAVGRYVWCKEAVIEHIHSSNNKRPADDLDMERFEKDYMELDRKIFEDRKAKGFPNDFNSVI